MKTVSLHLFQSNRQLYILYTNNLLMITYDAFIPEAA